MRIERRSLFSWFWKLVSLVALLEIGWIAKSILRSSQQSKGITDKKFIDAGMVDDFRPGSVTPLPKGQLHLARLVDGSFLALSISCTHLGCSVPWDAEKNTFICPCHGSTFDIRGNVLTPPALRPLDYFPILIENGLIRVDVSKPLRRELFLSEQATRM